MSRWEKAGFVLLAIATAATLAWWPLSHRYFVDYADNCQVAGLLPGIGVSSGRGRLLLRASPFVMWLAGKGLSYGRLRENHYHFSVFRMNYDKTNQMVKLSIPVGTIPLATSVLLLWWHSNMTQRKER